MVLRLPSGQLDGFGLEAAYGLAEGGAGLDVVQGHLHIRYACTKDPVISPGAPGTVLLHYREALSLIAGGFLRHAAVLEDQLRGVLGRRPILSRRAAPAEAGASEGTITRLMPRGGAPWGRS